MSTRYTEIIAGGRSYRLDRKAMAVFKEKAELHHVTSQNMQLLELFVSYPKHALVTRDQVFQHLYADKAVNNEAVDVAVKSLRKALGPGFIVTDHRKGYRLAADIRHFEEVFDDDSPSLPVTSEVPSSAESFDSHKEVSESAQSILTEIQGMSETFSDDLAYFDNLFSEVEQSLSERGIMLETWSTFWIGNSQPRQNYSAKRGYEIGWCEIDGKWRLSVKEFEIHTNYETFLGYQYNETFEISRTPLLEASMALKQLATPQVTYLLDNIRRQLKELSEVRGKINLI